LRGFVEHLIMLFTRKLRICHVPSIWVVLQFETGFRLEVATVRKLETENDAFAFGDKLIEKWYKTVEQGDKKGILLLVTSAKEGALTGGPSFMKVHPLLHPKYIRANRTSGSGEMRGGGGRRTHPTRDVAN
jgi:hypothetical protein